MTSTNSKISEFWVNGLLCAPVTPFTDNGDLNLSLIDGYVQHIIDYGILNAFVTGTIGEGNNMTVEERKRVAEAWISAGRDRLSAIIIHIGAGNLRDSQELARHAQEAGAHAIACVGPTYHKPDTLGEYVRYMQQVAAAAPELPFYLYDIDFVTGIGFNAVQFFDAALSVIPTLRGVKHTSPSLPSMLTLVARYGRRVQVLCGNDELYLASLAVGIEENIGQTFLGRVLIRMKEAFDKGDLSAARMEQVRALNFCAIRTKHGMIFPTFNKVVLHALGLDVGQPRSPLTPYSELVKSAVKEDLQAIGFFEWSK